ncbi:hypothetical protein AB4028_11775, partial [Janibacter sp. RAF20_2_2]
MSEPKPEVVTRALVQDVQLPADGGTLALITLDNGHDHTKPNTFGRTLALITLDNGHDHTKPNTFG